MANDIENPLGQLAHARLRLFEKAHVLDRDHSLVGEGGDEFDLLCAGSCWHMALFPRHASKKDCSVMMEWRLISYVHANAKWFF